MKKTKRYYELQVVSLILFMLSLNIVIEAQVSCDISIDVPQPVCYNTFFDLSVLEQSGFLYYWAPTGDTTSSITVKITEATNFTVRVIDTINHDTCTSAPFRVDMRPEITVSFTQKQLTCTDGDADNGNTAQIKAKAGNEFPADQYHYFWQVPPLHISPGDSSFAIGLKAHLNYMVKVIDKHDCSVVDTFYTKAFDNPIIEIKADPDTAYIENPHVTFSFTNLSEDSIKITNSFWEFDKDAESYSEPVLLYTFTDLGTYNVFLTVSNQYGCDTVYTSVVDVLPVNLLIPSVFTPNGDGINDTFIISEAPSSTSGGNDNAGGQKSINTQESERYKPLSRFYESYELVVFNRQGRKVFQSSNYQNDWDGGGLPDGVYFYVLKCNGYKNKNVVYKGSVSIFGSGR